MKDTWLYLFVSHIDVSWCNVVGPSFKSLDLQNDHFDSTQSVQWGMYKIYFVDFDNTKSDASEIRLVGEPVSMIVDITILHIHNNQWSHLGFLSKLKSNCDTPHSALVLLRHIQYCEGVCCVGGGCWSQAGQTRTTDVGYRFFILSVRAESSTLSQGQAIVCRCSGTTCLGGASPTRLFSMKSGR